MNTTTKPTIIPDPSSSALTRGHGCSRVSRAHALLKRLSLVSDGQLTIQDGNETRPFRARVRSAARLLPPSWAQPGILGAGGLWGHRRRWRGIHPRSLALR